MSGSDKKKSGPEPKPKSPGPKKPDINPVKDAPFDVDINDDGDMASPKRTFDEEEIKEEEDRRM